MASKADKEAKAAAQQAEQAAVVQGQQRLATEVTKAAAAFPTRRLRSAGDLSRYAIGGFADDPYASGYYQEAAAASETAGTAGGGGGAKRPPAPARSRIRAPIPPKAPVPPKISASGTSTTRHAPGRGELEGTGNYVTRPKAPLNAKTMTYMSTASKDDRYVAPTKVPTLAKPAAPIRPPGRGALADSGGPTKPTTKLATTKAVLKPAGAKPAAKAPARPAGRGALR